jgi:uncharacterized protein involved in exopolysaccharide biosynthesis
MNDGQVVAPELDRQPDDEFDLMDLMITLARRKTLIIGFPIGVAIIAALISLVLPNIYQSSAKLLPPQQSQGGAAALLSQVGGLAGAAAGVAGLKTPNDLYIGMLRSRTVADRLVAQFDLKKVYEADTVEKARRALETQTDIVSGKDGLITISVEDKDQKRVAKIANAYVSELIRLTRVLAVTESSQRRLFFEGQLESAKNNLAAVEVKLKGTLDSTGLVSVDGDSRAIVENMGRLRGQLSAKEIQLSAMNAFVTTSNPEYKRVQEELTSLRAELSRLENGRPARPAATGAESGKQEGLESVRLLRDLKYYQMLYELLAKQFEAARLEEAKDPAVVQILDAAIDPERKIKPNRSILVLVSTVVAFLLAVFWALISEVRTRAMLLPKNRERVAQLKSSLKFRKA